MRLAIRKVVHQHRARGLPVAAGASDLLVVRLDAAGQRQVHHRADVGLVHAHPEGDGRDHYVELSPEKRGLHLVANVGREPRVVGLDEVVAAQLVGHGLGHLACGRVDDRRQPPGTVEPLAGARGPLSGRNFERLQRKVVPAKPVDEEACLCAHAQLLDDVPLHHRGCCRGERDNRRRAQHRKAFPQQPVIGPEVVAPLRDAVGFVDGQ